MSVSRFRLSSATFAAFFFPAIALAQSAQEPPPETLRRSEQVTVTATRLEEDPERVGSSVTVIDAEAIAASGAHWLSDVLSRVPGVTVVRGGGPGAVTSAFLRGTNSNHTLVLIDGVKVNAPSTGAFDLAGLPASAVQRVEILRGPQSTLYGSDAIGGVINVITRGAGGAPRVALSAEGGSYGTSRLRAATQGEHGQVRWSVGAERFDAEGFSAADEKTGNVEPDGFRNGSLDARLGWRSDSGLDLEAFFLGRDGTVDLDGYDFLVGAVDDLNQTQDSRDVTGGVRARFGTGLWDGDLTLSVADQHLEVNDPDGFYPRFELDGELHEIDFQNTFRTHREGRLVAGVEVRSESTHSHSESLFGAEGYDEDVDLGGVYAEYRLATDAVHVTAGVRSDWHSRFGNAVTYRLTGAWRLSALQLHGSLGTGFRAPAFNELFYPGYGNTDLAPERSTGWDLGARIEIVDGALSLDATWFANDVEDLVQFAFPAGFVNVGQARTRGVEVSSSWQAASRLRFDTAYTYTDATDRDTGAALLRRPRHQGSLLGELGLGAVSLWSQLRVVGPRDDSGPAGTVSLPTYAVVSAYARWAFLDALAIEGRLDNLGDADYQEIYGYGTAGRSAYLGLTWNWSTTPNP